MNGHLSFLREGGKLHGAPQVAADPRHDAVAVAVPDEEHPVLLQEGHPVLESLGETNSEPLRGFVQHVGGQRPDEGPTGDDGAEGDDGAGKPGQEVSAGLTLHPQLLRDSMKLKRSMVIASVGHRAAQRPQRIQMVSSLSRTVRGLFGL